jgi:hypothetical protein
LGEQAAFFFTEEFAYDEKSVKKRLLKEGALGILREELAVLEAVPSPFTAAATEAALHALAERTGRGMGDLVHPVRVAVSGTGVGPGTFRDAGGAGHGARAPAHPPHADPLRRLRSARHGPAPSSFPCYGKKFSMPWKTLAYIFHAMEKPGGIFPCYGKKFSTLWKTRGRAAAGGARGGGWRAAGA